MVNLTEQHKDIPNLSEDFDLYLKKEAQIKELGYDPDSPCTIHFFEWSDFKQERIFDNEDEFAKFVKDCELKMMTYDEKSLKRLAHTTGAYVICKPKCHDLLVEANLNVLHSSFNRAVEFMKNNTYRSPAYAGYGGYNGYGEYDEWD